MCTNKFFPYFKDMKPGGCFPPYTWVRVFLLKETIVISLYEILKFTCKFFSYFYYLAPAQIVNKNAIKVENTEIISHPSSNFSSRGFFNLSRIHVTSTNKCTGLFLRHLAPIYKICMYAVQSKRWKNVLCTNNFFHTLKYHKTCLYILGCNVYIINRGLMPLKLVS